ncbi:MAG: adenylosuccinate synthase [Anaerolineaceae bacterium 4572_32.1]|nr:MAG: adenylosuccinate synthase [Anaerolineaceae bacterium 4572_32.1]
MGITVILGAQWGDEGKGKLTDRLAAESDIVARFNGGDNAGHTVTVGDEIFKLHFIPSGILHPDVTCIMGGGMVVNPGKLLKEMDALAERGVDVGASRLKLSGRTHLILPYHIALDGAAERALGKKKIGTTMRGIGPAYADKAARRGIRAQAMSDPEAFAERVKTETESKNEILTRVYGQEPLAAEAVAAEQFEYARRLAPHLDDTSLYLHEALAQGKNLLCEGAQATLLDIDHGTYPYVTSSSPSIGGVFSGLGIGPRRVERIIGIVKAFQTRVGGGPMPTELLGDLGSRLRGSGENPWDEFGTTTGRPRRCGWLDGVMLRYSARVNDLTELCLTKLDILTGLEELKICVAYDYKGRRLEHLPSEAEVLAECRPVYETLPGWQEDITGAGCFEDLPAAAQSYVRRVEELAESPAAYISVGPGREQTIVR